MGVTTSVFSREELDNYVNLTYFTRREVLKCWKKFRKLAPDLIDKDRKIRLPKQVMLECPELKFNPFGPEICTIFSSTDDGGFDFEDFLDMMSVFSSNAPLKLKAQYAFRIFDFNEDGIINEVDLRSLIDKLGVRNSETGEQILEKDYIDRFVDHILAESDLSDDGTITYLEFEQCLSKSKYFIETFQMRL